MVNEFDFELLDVSVSRIEADEDLFNEARRQLPHVLKQLAESSAKKIWDTGLPRADLHVEHLKNPELRDRFIRQYVRDFEKNVSPDVIQRLVERIVERLRELKNSQQ